MSTEAFDELFLRKLGIEKWPDANRWKKETMTDPTPDEPDPFAYYDEHPEEDPFTVAGAGGELSTADVNHRIMLASKLLQAAEAYLTCASFEDLIKLLASQL